MQDNWTLKIDPESRDLILDDAGALETISGDETTAQAVRLTLEVYRGEFPFDPTHGTEYERIMGKKRSELELSLIHISEPTRRTPIAYAVF